MESVDRGSKVYLKRAKRQISLQEREEALESIFNKGGIVIPCETAVTVHRSVGDPPCWEVVDRGMPLVVAKEGGALEVCVVDAVDGEKTCEFAITLASAYTLQESYFHTFVCVDDRDCQEQYALSFADGVIGRQTGTIIHQLLLQPTQTGAAGVEEVVEEGESETDFASKPLPSAQRKGGKRILKNIRRFFSSRHHDEGGRPRRLEISDPINFEHVTHAGTGPVMYGDNATECVGGGGGGVVVTDGNTGSRPKKRRPSGEQVEEVSSSEAKRKKVVISGPSEFRHMAHLGDTQFGESGLYAVPPPDPGQEAVDKRSSTASGGGGGSAGGGGVPRPDISAPFDAKHIVHVDKGDPIVHLLRGQGSKDPFAGASVTAGMLAGPAPDKPPRSTADLVSTNQAAGDRQSATTTLVSSGSGIEGEMELGDPTESTSLPQDRDSSSPEEKLENTEAGQTGEGEGKPFLSEEAPQKSTGSSDWSSISQTSDNVSLGTLLSQESQEDDKPPNSSHSCSVGTEARPRTRKDSFTQVSARERKDSGMQTDPAPPPPVAPPPPKVLTRVTSLPAMPFNHDDFLAEIESFRPSKLQDSALRRREGSTRGPAINRLSMQTMMRSSFDKMRDKLHSVWRESIFAYIPEEGDEFEEDGEEDYDFSSLAHYS